MSYVTQYVNIFMTIIMLGVVCKCNETKTPKVQKKGEAKKNQRLKALISTTAKNYVNKSET